ncbi:MAG: GNAT family N-acetyltransferase [Spirochaetales bacterium]|nr:GNAT family N-acetyltransferase [Spirochaetales bacterium]
MDERKPVIKKITKISRESIQLFYDFRLVMSFQDRQEPDFSIDNAAAEALKMIESGSEVFGLYQADALAGFASVSQKADKKCWLDCLYVQSDFRRRGFGTLLFDRASRFARKTGAAGLHVPVQENNEAMIAFLQKMGYTSD